MSKKYIKHVASRIEYPTTVGKSGTSLGSAKAQRAIEQRLGRQLKLAKKVETAKGNWVFYELRA